MKLDKRLAAQAQKRRVWLLSGAAAGLLAGGATIGQAWALARIVSGIFLEDAHLGTMASLLVLFAGGGIVRAAGTWGSRSAGSRLAGEIEEDLRRKLCRHLDHLGPAFATEKPSGELVSVLGEGIEKLDAYFGRYLPQLCLAFLIPAGILAAVFSVDPLSGLVLFLTAPLVPAFLMLVGWRAGAASARQWRTLSRLNARFLDLLQGLKTLKVLGRSREQVQRLGEEGEQYRKATMSVLRIAFLSSLTLELVATLSTAAVAVEVGLRLLYGRIEFAPALFVLILAPEFYLPLRQLGAHFHSSMEGVKAADGIFGILDTPLPRRGGMRYEGPVRRIDFDRVGLSYGSDRRALEEVSFGIEAGQMVALVGPSGAGKSSIVRLLLGFSRPGSGRVLIDGWPLDRLDLETWREQVAWVPDRPCLFRGSIAENLLLARPDAGREEMMLAARKAHLHQFVERLPEGYETQIGEGGARLSRGQAQRLAIARAFLKDAPLFLLDEPLAHLDPETGAQVSASLRELKARRTVLLVTHRLDGMLQEMDQVLVLEKGRVRAAGRPADLLVREGLYRRMFAAYRRGMAV